MTRGQFSQATIRAELVLTRKDPANAIEVFKKAIFHELGSPAFGRYNVVLYPTYVGTEQHISISDMPRTCCHAASNSETTLLRAAAFLH